jgi:hypothetical protein
MLYIKIKINKAKYEKMTKKECIKILNGILEYLPELDCFEDLCRELNIEEDELELALFSKITNITNDDLE